MNRMTIHRNDYELAITERYTHWIVTKCMNEEHKYQHMQILTQANLQAQLYI